MLSHLYHSQHHCADLRAESAHYNIRDAAGLSVALSAHLRADLGLDHAPEMARKARFRPWRGWRIGLRWPLYVERTAQ